MWQFIQFSYILRLPDEQNIKMKFRLLLFGSIFLTIASIFAQDDFLRGKLVDAQTSEPVIFATIGVKGKAVGVVSNMDGSFRIPEKFKYYGDTLEISSMGYKKRQIPISTLPKDQVRRIYLTPGVFELQEAVVQGKRKRKLSARAIVRRAIKNIPNNYPISSFSTVGYYRDYQLKENEYINLNEAIIEVYDSGFHTVDSSTSKSRIYEYRFNTDFERDKLADNPYNYINREKIIKDAYLPDYNGNEFSILRVHDAIRNYNLGSYSFIDQFDKDLLRNHTFSREGNTYVDGVPLYQIQFQRENTNHLAIGTLYISHGDFAIYRLKYSVYNLERKESKQVLDKVEEPSQLLFEISTEYQKKMGKMYPHYISFHNEFQLLKRSEFRVVEVFWNSKKQRFDVLFNKEPDKKDALVPENYSVVYKGFSTMPQSPKGYKLNFRLVISCSDEGNFLDPKAVNCKNEIRLYPEIHTEKDKEVIAQISRLAKNDKITPGALSIEIKNIRDNGGNLVNEKQYEDVHQYREYFVQQIKPDVSAPSANLYMDKRRPIFKDQPTHPPVNFDDYWMNSPLKSFE